MDELELKDKLKQITNAHGATGDEFRVAKVAAELIAPYVDKVDIDRFGNVTGFRSCGKEGAKSILLDAHIDQIGFRVTEITERGFLRFTDIGVDPRMMPNAELWVLTKEGMLPGIVSVLAPHMVKRSEEKNSIPMDKLYVDVGLAPEEVKKRVRVGDYMVFRNETFDLAGDNVCGRAMDDRACFICILRAMELLKDKQLPVDVYVTGSTKEEIGGHGGQAVSFRANPDFAIALDVTHAKTDDAPDMQIALGEGAQIVIGPNSRPEFAQLAIETARAKQIPFRTLAAPANTGTHARTIQLQRHGITTLLLSLPLRYMHSPVEVISMSDVEAVAKLLAELILVMEGRHFA